MITHDLEGIAKRVRILRGELTQTVFAAKVGLHVTQISRIEHAKHVPQYGTIAVIARACGVSPQWLMYGDDCSTPAYPAQSAVAVPAVSTGGGAISNTAIATAPGAMATTGAPAGVAPYAPADTAAPAAAQGAQGAQPLAAQPLAEISARLQAAERRVAALEQSMLAVQSAVIRGGVGAGEIPGSPSALSGCGVPGAPSAPHGGGDGATPSAGVEAGA